MELPATRKVIAALTRRGAEVRYVGGCVRDSVAGRPVGDIDIATHDPPETVMALLEEADIQAIPTGLGHGTVTAVADGRPFEITTLRHDVETFGRRARVEFTDDWIADAARRDFTINALSCAPDGWLYDPFGGLDDLKAGIVRFVGDPKRRIEEDVLRLLRFFRFYAIFGEPPPDGPSLKACAAMADRLGSLSGERVRAELLRLLVAPAAIDAVRLMFERRVLAHVLPEARNIRRLEGLARAELRVRAPADPVLRLIALLETDAAGGALVADRLRMSAAERRRIRVLLAARGSAELGFERDGMRRALHRLGRETFRDLSLLEAAADEDFARLERRWIQAARWTKPTLPVTGGDVLDLGVPTGPAVGCLLRKVEGWWAERGFVDDRTACLKHLGILARISGSVAER